MVGRCRVRVCFFLTLCLALCVIAVASNAHAAARVALVIGNGDYRFSKPLPNPVNDAHDIADALEQLDFTVIRVFNGDFGKIRDGIRAFNTEVEHADIGLIYYAGHGMELGGENWLIPVDAELKTDRDLFGEATASRRSFISQPRRRARTGDSDSAATTRSPPRWRVPSSRVRSTAALARRAERQCAGSLRRQGWHDCDRRRWPQQSYTAALLKHLGTRGLKSVCVSQSKR